MFDSILKKLNLCRAEELDTVNKTTSTQLDVLAKSIRDLKELLEFARKQNYALESKNDEYLSDIRARDEEIAALKQELMNEKYHLDKTRASLKVYKDAEVEGRIVINPCKPGINVYWVARGFSASVKPYAVEFNENLGYAIIELSVRAIITNDKGTMVLMDESQCIENIPSFHIEDFGKCVFTNINDAKSLFAEIIENTTLVKK